MAAAVEITRFTNEARRGLKEDGASIYGLEGTSIAVQTALQIAKHKPSFGFLITEEGRLTSYRSRLSEVAIYPDPKRFFVDGTGNKNIDTQEKLLQEDGERLRKRLRRRGIAVVIPEEASTLTEVTFKHLDKTGEWLFSERYAREYGLDWICGVTKNPILLTGSSFAAVGCSDSYRGLGIYACSQVWGNGDAFLAVRLVVPIR